MPYLDPKRKPEYDRAYYLRHREAKMAAAAKWLADHPIRARQRTANWRAANPERVAARKREWIAAHPEARATSNAQRRARVRGSAGSHTTQEWRDKLTLFAGCCIYCGESKPLTRDHKVPLARGGSNDISNLVPACLSCNARKGNKTAQEFMAA